MHPPYIEKERAMARCASLDPFLASDLDPIFWIPERLNKPSAWWGQIPFAFWITAVCKPRLLVELGTHYGVSYAAFCEAVARSRLETCCYAVDTWAGDAHAGFYGDEIYNELKDFHDKRYASFSDLLRKSFDDACGSFEDGTIDLLHIDGYHTYEAVRHDFETWRPKLSKRAVVLFHDTNVRRDDFGVGLFFGELKKDLPSFEFLHSYGLGVAIVGADAPIDARELCALTGDRDILAVRERFAHLGSRWVETAGLSLAKKNIQELTGHLQRFSECVAGKDAQIAGNDAQIAAKDAQIAANDAQIAAKDAQIAAKDAQIAEYLYHLDRINASPWWRFGMWLTRLTRAPLRLIKGDRADLVASEPVDSVIALPLAYQVPALWPIPRVAVLLHAYYVDQLPEFQLALKNIPFPFALFISTDSEQKRTIIEQSFVGWSHGSFEVHVFANRGRDIAPKLVGFRHVHERYEFVLHLHTKQSPHRENLKEWRPLLLNNLLGSQEIVAGVFEMFSQRPRLGIVAPRNFEEIRTFMTWGVNFDKCAALAKRMGITLKPESPLDFAAGSMFWARTAALKPLLDLDLTFDSFEEEDGQTDGAIAHAIERLTFYSCELAGYTWCHGGPEQNLAPFEKAFRISARNDFGKVLPRISIDLLAPSARQDGDTDALANSSENGDVKARFRSKSVEALTAFLAGNERIVLTTSDAPEVAIILVLFNGAELTFKNLEALRTAIDVSAEIIIVDNTSSDRTHELLSRVDGAQIIYNSENLHFLRAVNQGAQKAHGKYVLLLNNDTCLGAGPIRIARDLLDEDATVGAVGGKLVLPDGTLQEAGSIIWRDGSCLGYGRGRNPSEPEFQFRRDVDYCSGAFFMLRRSLFESLGWLNEQFAPAYYEETDLCMRIRAAGYRIIYEPRIEISHFEFGSSTTDTVLAFQQRNHTTFKKLHKEQLERQHYPVGVSPLEARMRSTSRRILIIDDRVPYPELGAGYPRMAELVREIHAMGWFVTLYPMIFPDVSWERAYRLLPRDIEIAADHGEYGLAPFLHERSGYYDAVLVSRPNNMERFRRACIDAPEFMRTTHVIYDAEALFTAREALRVALKFRPFNEFEYKAKLVAEFALTKGSKAIIAVSEREASLFRANCDATVHVVGHRLSPNPTPTAFEARESILFVGALNGNQETSPNVDALVWFVHEVMPLLDRRLGNRYKLLVAGRVESADVQVLANPRVELLGVIPDLTPLYDQARLFIAPTRFAAGIPLKVYEAAGVGLPIVATQLVVDQLNWADSVDILAANTAAEFAEACCRLYTDALLWTRLRENALERVARGCDESAFAKSVSAILTEVPKRHRN